MEEYVKTIKIIFKHPYVTIVMNLDEVMETKIVKTKPFGVPILIVEYKGYKNYDYFNFIHLEMAQKMKQAIDEKRSFVVLEEL